MRAGAPSLVGVILLSLAIASGALNSGSTTPHLNVLFIVVDGPHTAHHWHTHCMHSDMRPNIGAYNYTHAHTPYMDGFARSALTLTSGPNLNPNYD